MITRRIRRRRRRRSLLCVDQLQGVALGGGVLGRDTSWAVTVQFLGGSWGALGVSLGCSRACSWELPLGVLLEGLCALLPK
eukprot:9995997-Alexandrium_andersonii.AAC.1